jgi:hypothetical protein
LSALKQSYELSAAFMRPSIDGYRLTSNLETDAGTCKSGLAAATCSLDGQSTTDIGPRLHYLLTGEWNTGELDTWLEKDTPMIQMVISGKGPAVGCIYAKILKP